jgi:hypothetical protein
LRSQRVDTRQEFSKSLHDKGADGEGISKATNTMYKAAFGKNTKELYQEHEGKQGDRDTLPRDVQEEIIVHEIINKRRVQQHDVQSSEQRQINNELSDVVEDQTRQNKGFFGRLFGD